MPFSAVTVKFTIIVASSEKRFILLLTHVKKVSQQAVFNVAGLANHAATLTPNSKDLLIPRPIRPKYDDRKVR